MRVESVVLAGRQWDMPAGFAAMQRIDALVGDPYRLFLRMLTLQDGEEPFSLMQCCQIIAIGVQAAGCKETLETIGQWVIDEGVLDKWSGTASNYIGLGVMADPDKVFPDKKSNDSSKKKS